MDGYRGELEAARARISDLEAQLAEARAEIDEKFVAVDAAAELVELRKQLAQAPAALRGELGTLTGWSVICAVAAVALAGAGFFIASASPTASGPALSPSGFAGLFGLALLLGLTAIWLGFRRNEAARRAAFEDERLRRRIEEIRRAGPD